MIMLILAALLLAQPKKTDTVKIHADYAVRGPGQIVWIEAKTLPGVTVECTFGVRRIGHIEFHPMPGITMNPGETRKFDYGWVKEWIGNDLDKYESLEVTPNNCADVTVVINRPKLESNS